MRSREGSEYDIWSVSWTRLSLSDGSDQSQHEAQRAANRQEGDLRDSDRVSRESVHVLVLHRLDDDLSQISEMGCEAEGPEKKRMGESAGPDAGFGGMPDPT